MNYCASVGVANKCSLLDAAKSARFSTLGGNVVVNFKDGRKDTIKIGRKCNYKDIAAINSSIKRMESIIPTLQAKRAVT